MNFQKKKTIVISDNKFQNSISKIQIQFKNSRKNLSQDSNFDIIKSNLSKEESKNKNRKKVKIVYYIIIIQNHHIMTQKNQKFPLKK